MREVVVFEKFDSKPMSESVAPSKLGRCFAAIVKHCCIFWECFVSLYNLGCCCSLFCWFAIATLCGCRNRIANLYAYHLFNDWKSISEWFFILLLLHIIRSSAQKKPFPRMKAIPILSIWYHKLMDPFPNLMIPRYALVKEKWMLEAAVKIVAWN